MPARWEGVWVWGGVGEGARHERDGRGGGEGEGGERDSVQAPMLVRPRGERNKNCAF